MDNEKLQALVEDKNFNEKLENAVTEQEAESILKEYGIYDEVMKSAALTEEQLFEVSGGSNSCGIFGKRTCKYKCSCGKTFATKTTANYHALFANASEITKSMNHKPHFHKITSI